MSKAASGTEKLDLIAATSGRNVLAGNGFSSKRLGVELTFLLERSGLEPSAVDVNPSTQNGQADQPSVHFVCNNEAGKPCAVILLPMSLFERLFVYIYGGDRTGAAADDPGNAELRYAQRLGARLCEWLKTAWPDATTPHLTFAQAVFDAGEQEDGQSRFDAAMHLGAEIILPGGSSQKLHVSLASALLSDPVPQQARGQASARSADWKQRLIGRAGHVLLPVRSEIAVVSMPAARLLALQPGDVLPMAMPRSIPVLVGGKPFASASLGEWQGSAALRIETLNESPST